MTKVETSVVMPIRAIDDFVFEACASILSQEYDQFEFIIVADSSVRDAIIAHFADDTFRFAMCEKSTTFADKLNLGFSLAAGRFIARLDADDIALAERLLEQTQFLKANPDVVAVGSNAYLIDRNGDELGVTDIPSDVRYPKSLVSRPISVIHPSVVIRASALRGLSVPTNIVGLEDYWLWLNLALKGKIVNTEKPLIKYRIHTSQMSGYTQNFDLNIFLVEYLHRKGLIREFKIQEPLTSPTSVSGVVSFLESQFSEEGRAIRLLLMTKLLFCLSKVSHETWPDVLPRHYRLLSQFFGATGGLCLYARDKLAKLLP